MKRIIILLTLASLIFVAEMAKSDIPHLISFQGKATDKQNAPLNGTYDLTFRIYNHATAGDPNAANDPYRKWKEVHTNVQITNGIFQVLLGSITPLNLPFDEDYWITVEVNQDGEMSPRTRLASMGYAYMAEKAMKSGLPSGIIVMWSGSIASIPKGWALCDGTNGTPDLRDRFIVGARQDDSGIAKTNVSNSLEQVGGEAYHKLTINEMPAHTHSLNGGYRWYDGDQGQSYSLKGGGSISTNSSGGDQPHNNLPPYYALAFIMKL